VFGGVVAIEQVVSEQNPVPQDFTVWLDPVERRGQLPSQFGLTGFANLKMVAERAGIDKRERTGDHLKTPIIANDMPIRA
jgi:hypothetical protein